MKTLIWADLHGHNFREFSTTEGGVNTRLKDCADVIEQILFSARKEKVNEIWFVGDLFHLKNNLDNQVIKAIMYEMKNLANEFPIFLIPGNHDYRAWSSDPILLEILEEMPGRLVLCEQGYLKVESQVYTDVYIEPYTRKIDELNKRISELEVDFDNCIFFGHQDILGMKYGGFTVEKGLDADMLSKKFKWSFIGHWHIPNKVRENVVSIGAPLQHNFGDINQPKGWWIFEGAEDNVRLIQNDSSPRFWDIKVSSETTEFPGDSQVDFYRIKTKGDLPEFMDVIKWKRISREVDGKTKKRTAISFSDKKEDIIEKYVKVRGGDLDSKKLIEMGRKYLI